MLLPLPDDGVHDVEIAEFRRKLAEQAPDQDLAATRRRLDAKGEELGLPPGVTTERVDAGGVPGEWVTPDEDTDGRALLYIHSGGFVAGSIASDRHLAGRLGREARARVMTLDYRLAPEHPFPAAVDDVMRVYRFLLASGQAPNRLAVAGLSAGGNLALGLAISARDSELALPACLWLASPWSDLTNSGDTFTTHAVIDPVIRKAMLDEYARSYLGGASSNDPLASPCFGNLQGLPPTLIQVGAAETLLGDASHLCLVAGTANVAVTLQVWPRMVHAFHLSAPELTAGREAISAAGRFIRIAMGEDVDLRTPDRGRTAQSDDQAHMA